MPEFFHVLPPAEAYVKFEALLKPIQRSEKVATKDALGRVLATEMNSPSDLPSFPRSSMDGYAVRASDTYGASESLPASLKVMGEILMGQASSQRISSGEAVKVHTGGMVPHGADAVAMLENTQQVDSLILEVLRPVAVGENVIQVGEDVRKGQSLIPKGHMLRPQDIGGLLALGITEVTVFAKLRVAIISTGDEIVPPEVTPGPAQVRDINTYTLSGLIQQAGGVPSLVGIIPDNYAALREALAKGLEDNDAVIISAGSSVSARDITAKAIDSLGKPGILVHGVSIRPGKPTVLALIGDKPVFGLPGNPVSAMVTFRLFVRPTIYRMSNCINPPRVAAFEARLARNIASAAGREDYVPVRLERKDGELWAEPVFGKSNLIYSLVRADGLVQVPLDKTGIAAGELVIVEMF
ncbi:MAG: molybdopterin molybdotransferase MoeA [Chloroflexi bacterium]|nr:molybdopterin molybdotransferase MoeA [Chloroflexota bacterium]